MPSQNKYAFEIRFLQMFFFPPWAMYKIITGPEMRKNKIGIFLIAWTVLQWLLLISVGSNKLVSFIYANIAIAFFYLFNIFVGLDLKELSDEEQNLINTLPLKIIATASSFFIMFSIPKMLSKIYSHTNLSLFSNNITWSSLSIIVGGVLVISWMLFMFIDRYNVFSLFPKTEYKEGLYRLMPITSEKMSYCQIWCLAS